MDEQENNFTAITIIAITAMIVFNVYIFYISFGS